MNEETLFHEARQKPSGDRAAFLEEACAGDVILRERIEVLLRADEQPDSFLEPKPPATIAMEAVTEAPGTVIGPYKLLQQIGEGGMGVVFMAEQTRPVQRTVALKIIKPGMDTRQVITRFEAERQAVAIMDHPNIAKVLDAGATDSGRPYFVMDLVKGVPITEYCDQQQLTIRERLELFTQVCHAIQHAHQKGIIHRDLKPSNVLVAEYDGKPVPKIIDFGVAKATAQKLTERTMFTEYGQLIGTFEYMSPEQARFNQFDVDTRSDIYSLGVLLYELLAGSPPFEQKQYREAAFDEMLRIIREEEPPRPSSKLSTSDMLPSIAANRHSEPKRLTQDVDGELDWIVMKALEKDRSRRYDSANGFAADIKRHLNDKPVEAGPPSTAYRLRKFAKRNRMPLAAGTLLALVTLLALGAIASGIWERRARQARVTGQLEIILGEVERLQQAEKWHEALVAAQRAEPALAAGDAAPEIEERTRQTLADLELVQRLDEIRMQSGTPWSDAEVRMARASQAEQEYAAAFRQAGIDVDTLPLNEAVDRITDLGSISAAVLPALDDWVAVRSVGDDEAATRRLLDVLRAADPDSWRRRVREALARKDWPTLQNLTTSAELDRQSAATLSFLYAALHASDTLYLERELVLRRAQWKYPNDFWINHRLGINLIYRQDGYGEEGIGYMRAALAVRPESAHALMNLGNGYAYLGRHDDAIAYYRRAIELRPNNWGSYYNLGESLCRKGLHEGAIGAFEETIRIQPNYPTVYAALSLVHSNRPDTDLRNPSRATELANKAIEMEPRFGNNWTALGIARYREGQWQEAATAFDRALQLEMSISYGGTFRWPQAIGWFFLAMCHKQLGHEDQARQSYHRAIQSMNERQTAQADIDQLQRIRAEAEELLKIDNETTTK